MKVLHEVEGARLYVIELCRYRFRHLSIVYLHCQLLDTSFISLPQQHNHLQEEAQNSTDVENYIP